MTDWKIVAELENDAVEDIDFLKSIFEAYKVFYEPISPYMLETTRTIICVGHTRNYSKVIQELTRAKASNFSRQGKRMIGYFIASDSNRKQLHAICEKNRVLDYIRTPELEDDTLNVTAFLQFLSSLALEEYEGYPLFDRFSSPPTV